ncbi:MAG: polysaccharide biosynthesis/export family protein [Elusimicrobiota bacterium]
MRGNAALGLACLMVLAGGCGGVSFHVGDPAAEPSSDAADGEAPRAKAVASREETAVQDALQYVAAQRVSYKISSADLLEITVYQEGDLNRKVRVSPNGVITFPLVGKVQVAGLSVPQAEQAVTEKLRRYVIDPQVSIFITDYGNKQVYVLGEVKKPGSYPLPTEAALTVIEAITLAGGFTEYAAVDRTRVIRKSPGGTQNFAIEVTEITKRGDKSKDIQLLTNDVVFVPESFF